MKTAVTKWIKSLLFFTSSAILIISLLSFSKNDFPLLTSSPSHPPSNLAGIFGAYLAGIFFFILGYSAYLASVILILFGLKKLNLRKDKGIIENPWIELTAVVLTIVSFSLLLSINGTVSQRFERGGLLGFTISSFSIKYLGVTGSFIIGTVLFFIGILPLESELIFDMFSRVKNFLSAYINNLKDKRKIYRAIKEIKPEKKKVRFHIKQNIPAKASFRKPENTKKPQPEERIRTQEEDKSSPPTQEGKYTLPDFSLIKEPPPLDDKKAKETIELTAKNLEETLADFGIEARVVNVEQGPVVTRYELEPAPGIKITRIASLSDDIALSLKSSQVRIVAPLPGKGTVGIEVPNAIKHIVYLREVIETKEFLNSKSKLTLAIGKDVGGNPLIANLKDMPHLLIAGTTGSGKTVCVNSMISALLFKAKPWEVKFLLIDPKMVELVHFTDIPHLLAPVVSETKKAKGILAWATEEMDKRYSLLAEEGTRNIDLYNSRKNRNERMPFIVIVIDELADLMITARDEVETSILRLAQLSRAVGIHLIMATQRPSVDVITGVIKANFPARISFKVASKVDSRTVMDFMGAEKLLGKGDLLFIKPGLSKPIRAQSCFLTEEDIETIVNSVKKYGRPEYNKQILELQKRPNITLEQDELIDDAIKVILETNQASASLLQRRMRVGYTRAARLLDLMEQRGVIGPFQGSKAREILVDREEYLSQNNKDV